MEFPMQEPSSVRGAAARRGGGFDMRDWLTPRRMTIVMWDQAFLTRHMPGDSFEDYDRALDEALERGYNTLRIDPLPQLIDLSRPEKVNRQPDLKRPYMPWTRPEGFEGPAGEWLIEFMEKLLARPGLYYTLSAWWGSDYEKALAKPKNLAEAAEVWAAMLRQWKRRFGFDRCVYVDLNNEFPCFLASQQQDLVKQSGPQWSPEWSKLVCKTVNEALGRMRDEFPELLFTVSLHGNVEYCGIDFELDCMDIHFYSDADPRWFERTRFHKYAGNFFHGTDGRKDFSDRCEAARSAAAMFRARQRAKVAAFAEMAVRRGMPLTTSESWASWYYIDCEEFNWDWLLEWAEWSVEDAVDYGMWGWTPHNYVQPQFENWKDVEWHRRLTRKFLRS